MPGDEQKNMNSGENCAETDCSQHKIKQLYNTQNTTAVLNNAQQAHGRI